MSVDALSWAFRLELPPREKLLLLHYADRADEDGECHPSHHDTEERTGLCNSSLRDLTTTLIDRGLMERQARFANGGRQTSNTYVLRVGEAGNTTLRPIRVKSAPACRELGTPPAETTTPPPAEPAAPHFVEPSGKEPPDKPSVHRAPRVSAGGLKEEHDVFYRQYPRHDKPLDSLKAYIKARKEGASHEEIMAGLARYRFNPPYVTYPATWLNAGNWKAEPPDLFPNGQPAGRPMTMMERAGLRFNNGF